MGEKATLRMARRELEDLYLGLGVPDESVDLTFKDLMILPSNSSSCNINNNNAAAAERATTTTTKPNIFAFDNDGRDVAAEDAILISGSNGNSNDNKMMMLPSQLDLSKNKSMITQLPKQPQLEQAAAATHHQVNYKRPGIPHSNICTLCSNYVYLFRNRCLVCGRVYCRQCVLGGMGKMTEGRKCIDCLGRRYSHRYIHKAGKSGCWWRYTSGVKIQELIWADKGPAPRPRPRPRPRHKPSSSSWSSSAFYSTTTINTSYDQQQQDEPMPPSKARMKMTSSFVASSSATFSPNPHAFPL